VHASWRERPVFQRQLAVRLRGTLERHHLHRGKPVCGFNAGRRLRRSMQLANYDIGHYSLSPGTGTGPGGARPSARPARTARRPRARTACAPRRNVHAFDLLVYRLASLEPLAGAGGQPVARGRRRRTVRLEAVRSRRCIHAKLYPADLSRARRVEELHLAASALGDARRGPACMPSEPSARHMAYGHMAWP